jgi:hypothetical protein
MDGRLHMPVMTETPLGIIQPFRNLGGVFDLGWHNFQLVVKEWVDYATHRDRNRKCMVMVTYHYSRGDVHRGCAGHKYDTEAAKASAAKLVDQFSRVFGRTVVYPVLVGIETDLEALVLHGVNGEVIDLADLTLQSVADLPAMLRRLYPDMHPRIADDFLPLLQGNLRHIDEVRRKGRPVLDSEHREWVIAVGRGFDWLHKINTALIVGPYPPDLVTPIETAAKVIKGNLEGGRIMGKKIVLMTSAPFRDDAGYEKELATEKALFLSKFALDVIRGNPEFKDLLPHLQVLAGRVNLNTRVLEVLRRADSVEEIDKELLAAV